MLFMIPGAYLQTCLIAMFPHAPWGRSPHTVMAECPEPTADKRWPAWAIQQRCWALALPIFRLHSVHTHVCTYKTTCVHTLHMHVHGCTHTGVCAALRNVQACHSGHTQCLATSQCPEGMSLPSSQGLSEIPCHFSSAPKDHATFPERA